MFGKIDLTIEVILSELFTQEGLNLSGDPRRASGPGASS